MDHWQRYREPFLDRNPDPGSWDHAMAWMSAAVPVGDEMLLYYGGYARGHKVEPKTERQIGLARMKRDRYVALAPILRAGHIDDASRSSFEAAATSTRVRNTAKSAIRLVGNDGKPLRVRSRAGIADRVR